MGKTFNSGVVIPAEMRFCNKYNDKILYDDCNNQINENEELEDILILLKRHSLDQFGRMFS